MSIKEAGSEGRRVEAGAARVQEALLHHDRLHLPRGCAVVDHMRAIELVGA